MKPTTAQRVKGKPPVTANTLMQLAIEKHGENLKRLDEFWAKKMLILSLEISLKLERMQAEINSLKKATQEDEE